MLPGGSLCSLLVYVLSVEGLNTAAEKIADLFILLSREVGFIKIAADAVFLLWYRYCDWLMCLIFQAFWDTVRNNGKIDLKKVCWKE
jgi:diacylglycerol kinase